MLRIVRSVVFPLHRSVVCTVEPFSDFPLMSGKKSDRFEIQLESVRCSDSIDRAVEYSQIDTEVDLRLPVSEHEVRPITFPR